MAQDRNIADLLVIGGGVNGCGIARDAAGRGLSVVLCEKGDLAGATSSASTKLFHGGLRYLEQYDFALVRKALIEREVLLSNMPHISRAMRFVLPHAPGMRPAWLLRLGLFIYDHLGGRRLLPGTKVLDLRHDPAGAPLKPRFTRAFEYSDGWVDDARLVVLNARDASLRGADIRTRTRIVAARREGGFWRVEAEDTRTGTRHEIGARALVNAAGPWVNIVLEQALGRARHDPIRLVRGSHVVVPRLFDHGRAYFFQNADARIFFAIPFDGDFTLIGTTDVDHSGSLDDVACTDDEVAYLCNAASEYFAAPVRPDDVVWRFSGVRPLEGDPGGSASKASRDYHIAVEDVDGAAPLITVYGGKITTYRKLSEQVVAELAPYLELSGLPWTDHVPLPGGDFPFDGIGALIAELGARYPFLGVRTAERLARGYGTDAVAVLGEARTAADLGTDFGAGLFEAELRWLTRHEWAETAEDVLWRRTKLGLRLEADAAARIDGWLKENRQ